MVFWRCGINAVKPKRHNAIKPFSMKVAVFSTHAFEQPYLESANNGSLDLHFFEEKLNEKTAVLAKGYEAVSLFVSDDASAAVLKKLKVGGCQYVALRSAGFNHVDLGVAQQLGIQVARVPEYSPYAIAEHTLALILALNRKLIRANNRVKELNFSLNGLIGFDLNGKTVGVVGTGKIGSVLVKILHGFGCSILAYDLEEDTNLITKYNVQYTSLSSLLEKSDIISLKVSKK